MRALDGITRRDHWLEGRKGAKEVAAHGSSEVKVLGLGFRVRGLGSRGGELG